MRSIKGKQGLIVLGILGILTVPALAAATPPAQAMQEGAAFLGRSAEVRGPGGNVRTVTIERKLGQGATAMTFLGRDASGPVAIKIARNGPRAEGTRLGFDREAKTLRTIEGADPGLPSGLGVGRMVRPDGGQGQRVLVMQVAKGRALGTQGDHPGTVWDTPREPVGPVIAARILQRAAEIVGAMHESGVAHRDVHPGNLRMVGGDVGSLTLLDYGSAGPLNDAARAKDLWSLGRLLTYLTTAGPTDVDAMPRVRRIVDGRVVTLAGIARRATQGEFANVWEFRDALTPFTGL